MAQVGLAGCGSDDGLARHPISGSVTFDGKPLANGSIQFFPSATTGPAIASGAAIEEGQYAIPTDEGLVAGPYTVRITSMGGKAKAKGKGKEAVGESVAEGAMPGFGAMHPQDLIPPRYNVTSELTATVKEEGPNEFNFDLEKGSKETAKSK